MSAKQSSPSANHSIIHVDMDAFYASVEQRDFPEFRGKPLIVGGDPNARGVVATCSYEARKFGVHSAMPSALARRKCPQGIFVRPRFGLYREISAQIRHIFQHYTALVEPLSLDEAYLDVSAETQRLGSGVLVAKDIRQRIQHETGLTASAGVSYNKFLAKIASDRCKPNGLLLISAQEGPSFVRTLKIREFHGIGPATEDKMHRLGIYTGEDLLAWNLSELQSFFGKSAYYYFNIARGIDLRSVEPYRERKSVSTEDTFEEDISDPEAMLKKLRSQLDQVMADLARLKVTARTLTVKVKFADFSIVTRSKSIEQEFADIEAFASLLPELLDNALNKPLSVRLLGIAASNLAPLSEAKNNQISLL